MVCFVAKQIKPSLDAQSVYHCFDLFFEACRARPSATGAREKASPGAWPGRGRERAAAQIAGAAR
jgi:hypothetical protein